MVLLPADCQAVEDAADCETSLLTSAAAERCSDNAGGLLRFGGHVLLFRRFRDRAAIRDAWCSDLALQQRTVSGTRVRHPRRSLSDLEGPMRVAFRRDRLLQDDHGGSDRTSEKTQ